MLRTTRPRLLAGILSISILFVGASRSDALSGTTHKPAARPAATAPSAVQNGDQGDLVKYVQYRLKSFGYSIAVDGIFGPQTEKAVLHWQKVNGLVVDGVVGPQTLASLGLDESLPPKQQAVVGSGTEVAAQALRNAGANDWEVQFGTTICYRESRCTLNAVNQNSKTRDDSWGPWQINYYGSLIGREQTIGTRQSNTESWESAADNFLHLLRASGACHWSPPSYCS